MVENARVAGLEREGDASLAIRYAEESALLDEIVFVFSRRLQDF